MCRDIGSGIFYCCFLLDDGPGPNSIEMGLEERRRHVIEDRPRIIKGKLRIQYISFHSFCNISRHPSRCTSTPFRMSEPTISTGAGLDDVANLTGEFSIADHPQVGDHTYLVQSTLRKAILCFNQTATAAFNRGNRSLLEVVMPLFLVAEL